MSEDKQVLVTLNPFGYGIKDRDIDRILNPTTEVDKTESAHVAHFFSLPIDKLTRELLTRYVIACEAMNNVSVGSYHDEIRVKLINMIANAKRCFCYGEYLACIELCALHGEMLANFLCIVNKEFISNTAVTDKLSDWLKNSVQSHLSKDDFYDAMNQKHRILWLMGGDVLSKNDGDDLLEIHEIRKKYFHHWEHNHGDVNNDALNSLTMISKVASKHLEVLNNQSNVAKIRAYMSKNNVE